MHVFRHIKSLGWDFISRIRGTIQFCLLHDDERWLKITDVRGKPNPEYLGAELLGRAEYARCSGHFYLHKRKTKGRKINVPEGDYPIQRQKWKSKPQKKNLG